MNSLITLGISFKHRINMVSMGVLMVHRSSITLSDNADICLAASEIFCRHNVDVLLMDVRTYLSRLTNS